MPANMTMLKRIRLWWERILSIPMKLNELGYCLFGTGAMLLYAGISWPEVIKYLGAIVWAAGVACLVVHNFRPRIRS